MKLNENLTSLAGMLSAILLTVLASYLLVFDSPLSEAILYTYLHN